MDYYEFDVVINTSAYETMQSIANDYKVNLQDLWGAYKAMITANFEQDLHDLAKEIEDEEV